MQDPFIRAEQVIQGLEQQENRVNKFIEEQNLSKIYKFEGKKDKLSQTVLTYQHDLSTFKSLIYFSKKLKVHDSIYRELTE